MHWKLVYQVGKDLLILLDSIFFKWKEAECNTNLKQFKYILMLIIADSSKGISETWVVRQRLEDLYKKLLLMDLEYALDKKVEQDLYV